MRLDNPGLCVVCDKEFDADSDPAADGIDGNTRCRACRDKLPPDEWRRLYEDFYGIEILELGKLL
jgi:hypothetical protein